jgi:hypothetical protein
MLLLRNYKVALVCDQCGIGEQEAKGTCPQPSVASLDASGVVFVLEVATGSCISEVLGPETRLQQEARNRLKEDAARRLDEVHVHLLGNEDVPRQQELVVQRPRRHRPARNPQPGENIVKPVQVELLLDAGYNIVTGGGHIIILPYTIGR